MFMFRGTSGGGIIVPTREAVVCGLAAEAAWIRNSAQTGQQVDLRAAQPIWY